MRTAIYERDSYRCLYCGERRGREDLTLDHLNHRAGNNSKNLVTSCRTCNSRKGNIRTADFLSILEKEGRDKKQIQRDIRNTTRRKVNHSLLEDEPYSPTRDELEIIKNVCREGENTILETLYARVTPANPIWRAEQKTLQAETGIAEKTLQRRLRRLENAKIIGVDRKIRPHGYYFQPMSGDRCMYGVELDQLTTNGSVKLVDNSGLLASPAVNSPDRSPSRGHLTGHPNKRNPMDIPEFKDDFFNLRWSDVYKNFLGRKAKAEAVKNYYDMWQKEYTKKHPRVLAKNLLTREDLKEYRNDRKLLKYMYLAAGWCPTAMTDNRALLAMERIIRRVIQEGGTIYTILDLCDKEAEEMVIAVNNRLNNKGSHEALIKAEKTEYHGVDYKDLCFRTQRLKLITSKVPVEHPTPLRTEGGRMLV